MLVHALHVLPDTGGAVLAGDGPGADVFIHGQVLEHPPALRHHDRAVPDDLGPEPVGDVHPPEMDVAALDEAVLRFEQPADGPQGGCLAGPVGAQKRHDAAFRHAEADPAQHLDDVVVDNLDIVHLEKSGVFGRRFHRIELSCLSAGNLRIPVVQRFEPEGRRFRRTAHLPVSCQPGVLTGGCRSAYLPNSFL